MVLLKKKILVIALVGIIVDRISKILVSSSNGYVVIKNFFNITYAKNFGAAWSMFSGNRLFLIIITVFTLLFILFYIYKAKNINKIETLSYGFILGGIIGNFIDRLFFGYVIDFLDFNLFGYNFPIFNIADSLIVIGAIIMIIASFVRGDRNESSD